MALAYYMYNSAFKLQLWLVTRPCTSDTQLFNAVVESLYKGMTIHWESTEKYISGVK